MAKKDTLTKDQEYLVALVATETGKDILRSLFDHAEAIIEHPTKATAASTAKVCQMAQAELARRYPTLV